ncbi:hypothetical protein DFH08DRAFT_953115 [Mycena albidolilacea]|uniref:Uncharacterized protein n=1 Tax=Mycena albidolilacea TaxID=1033008 RepID=A0AAD7EXL8_9AGAR|nr:hypothetical protein DFH08DRAFT_953115 [Mycena albidolilacea]
MFHISHNKKCTLARTPAHTYNTGEAVEQIWAYRPPSHVSTKEMAPGRRSTTLDDIGTDFTLALARPPIIQAKL